MKNSWEDVIKYESLLLMKKITDYEKSDKNSEHYKGSSIVNFVKSVSIKNKEQKEYEDHLLRLTGLSIPQPLHGEWENLLNMKDVFYVNNYPEMDRRKDEEIKKIKFNVIKRISPEALQTLYTEKFNVFVDEAKKALSDKGYIKKNGIIDYNKIEKNEGSRIANMPSKSSKQKNT
jgi:hypothetical protein